MPMVLRFCGSEASTGACRMKAEIGVRATSAKDRMESKPGTEMAHLGNLSRPSNKFKA